jgi:hypothetical protein
MVKDLGLLAASSKKDGVVISKMLALLVDSQGDLR